MAVPVLICHKTTDANVHQDIRVKIVKMKKLTARRIHVQREQCARMNRAMEISLACAEVATLEQIVM